jgi:hypothetical protein
MLAVACCLAPSTAEEKAEDGTKPGKDGKDFLSFFLLSFSVGWQKKGGGDKGRRGSQGAAHTDTHMSRPPPSLPPSSLPLPILTSRLRPRLESREREEGPKGGGATRQQSSSTCRRRTISSSIGGDLGREGGRKGGREGGGEGVEQGHSKGRRGNISSRR